MDVSTLQLRSYCAPHHLTKGLLQLPYEQVISETIKERTVLQIKTALQKKAYEEAGIQVQNSVPTNKIMQGMLIAVTIQRQGRQRSCSSRSIWRKLCRGHS